MTALLVCFAFMAIIIALNYNYFHRLSESMQFFELSEALNSTIDTVSAEVRGNDAVPPSQKTRVMVNQLHDLGIFELKDSAQIAARQLDISVHSIYRYLREIKKG